MATNITDLVNSIQQDRQNLLAKSASFPLLVAVQDVLINHFSRPVFKATFMEDDQLVKSAYQAFQPNIIPADMAKQVIAAYPASLDLSGIDPHSILWLRQSLTARNARVLQATIVIYIAASIDPNGRSRPNPTPPKISLIQRLIYKIAALYEQLQGRSSQNKLQSSQDISVMERFLDHCLVTF